MSRLLIRASITATLAAMLIAAEMKSPDITLTTLQVIALVSKHLLTAGWWAVVVIAALVGIGYVIAILRHHPAIRDAHVERIHEKRIAAFRANETARLAKDLAPFRLRDQHANKPGAN